MRRARARRWARSPTRSSSVFTPPPRRDAYRLGRLRAVLPTATRTSRRVRREVEAFAEAEGRRPRMLVVQARPGRPRPRHEGDRDRLRRPRLRRRRRPALPDAGRGGAPGDRERRARGRRLERRRPATRRWCPQLVEALRAQGARDIVGRRGRRDPAARTTTFLREHGVAAIFGPGTPVPKAAREVLAAIRARTRRRMSPGARRVRSRRTATACAPAIGARSPRRSRCSRARRADHAALGQAVLDALVPHTGARDPGRHHRPAGRRQEHLHRGARPAAGRVGQARRGAGGRSRRARVTGGSILGDKTRMERLAQEPSARSSGRRRRAARWAASPTARARRCWCCEAAGFDVVIVETVGIGQSEVAVALDGRLLRSCCSSRARATSCRASRRACSSSPTRWS